MRVLVDACVLYPTVLRDIVLSFAETGAFAPLWSERILEEWRRAAARHGDDAIAQIEIAAVRRAFPQALVSSEPATEARLSLPDENDVHVLAAAIDGRADELLTLNLKDFPGRTLARDGIVLRAPDEFLLEHYHAAPEVMASVLHAVLERARLHGIDTSEPRKLLKRVRLPKLGKAVYAP